MYNRAHFFYVSILYSKVSTLLSAGPHLAFYTSPYILETVPYQIVSSCLILFLTAAFYTILDSNPLNQHPARSGYCHRDGCTVVSEVGILKETC